MCRSLSTNFRFNSIYFILDLSQACKTVTILTSNVWIHIRLWTANGTKRRTFTLRWRNLKTEVSLWKRIRCTSFPSTLRRKNLKTQQSPVVLDLCLRKIREGKSHDYRDYIIVEKLCFQNAFRPHDNEKPPFSNSSRRRRKQRCRVVRAPDLKSGGSGFKSRFDHLAGVVSQ